MNRTRSQSFAINRLCMDMGYHMLSCIRRDNVLVVALRAKWKPQETIRLAIQPNGEWSRHVTD